jgi:hypothetical protein
MAATAANVNLTIVISSVEVDKRRQGEPRDHSTSENAAPQTRPRQTLRDGRLSVVEANREIPRRRFCGLIRFDDDGPFLQCVRAIPFPEAGS